jgi:hypothetical protein
MKPICKNFKKDFKRSRRGEDQKEGLNMVTVDACMEILE